MTTSYRYRAVRADGSLEVGVVDAGERETAATLLSARGLFPVALERAVHTADTLGLTRTVMRSTDLSLGLRALATLLEAGLPMSRTLSAFADLAPDAWQPALPSVRQAVREGHGLATALRGSGLGVPSLVLGLIEAGEAGSGLPSAVRRAAELTERQAALRSAVRSALAYPLMLAATGVLATVLLVGVVLPRFAVVVADLGQSLPPVTRFVLTAASWGRALALPVLIATVGAWAAWRTWTGTQDGRERWHAMLLAVPVIGPARRSAAAARMCGAAASLLESGVPVAGALLHAARAAGDAAVARRILAARTDVLHGVRVAYAIGAHDAATPTVVKLVHAGEESGRLAAMLSHAARFESERAEAAVKNMVRLLEPLLLLAFGALVAVVAAAMLQAVYSVRPVS